jgi:hypothetical protein
MYSLHDGEKEISISWRRRRIIDTRSFAYHYMLSR